MTAHTTPEAPHDKAFEIHCIRSGLLVTSWALETLNPGNGTELPEGQRRYDLYEGSCYLLDLLAFRLDDLYRREKKE